MPCNLHLFYNTTSSTYSAYITKPKKNNAQRLLVSRNFAHHVKRSSRQQLLILRLAPKTHTKRQIMNGPLVGELTLRKK
jgi:hypothetical protein